MTNSPGALRAASIITRAEPSSKRRFNTSYGFKTVQGVADVIDSETAASELLVALKSTLATAIGHAVDAGHDKDHLQRCHWVTTARAAIAKAERQS